MDKISSLQDKKIAELLRNIPEPTGQENRTYPDGFYKLEFDGDKPLCPDCEGRLLGGPEAGGSMNVMCQDCETRFNYTSFNGMLERMEL